MILCGRKLPLFSVDRSTGGGEDHLAHPVLDAVFEEAYRTQHVHFRIEIRLANGTPYVHLSCLVAECLWHEVLEDLLAPRADIHLVEVYPLRDVLALAAGKVIDYGYLVAASEECFGHVGADKPCAPT
jgi:hypothetical protein